MGLGYGTRVVVSAAAAGGLMMCGGASVSAARSLVAGGQPVPSGRSAAAVASGGGWGVGIEAVVPANACAWSCPGVSDFPDVYISSVSCPSAGACSAVGGYNDNSGKQQGVLLTEKQGKWSSGVEAVLPTNADPTDPVVALSSVSCASAGNCSAVGSYKDSSGKTQGILLTEKQGKWSTGVDATDASTDQSLDSVSCASAEDCTAVGSVLLTETDGSWSTGVKPPLPANADPTTPGVALSSVSCASAGNCSAVGSYRDESTNTQGLLLTETDGSWSTGVEAALPANADPTLGFGPFVILSSVSCSSAGNCSAVGRYADSSRNLRGLLLSQTDGNWSTGVEAALPANTHLTSPFFVELSSVSCASAGNCSAGGSYYDNSGDAQGLLLNETAGDWAAGIEALPAEPFVDVNHGPPGINSVSCSSAGNCSAVGSYFDHYGGVEGLLLTETAGSWATGKLASIPANAEVSYPIAELYSVSCASAGHCSAGGFYHTFLPRGDGNGGLLIGGSPAAVKVKVSKNGTGSGRVASAPRGIRCGSRCSASFHAGTALTLRATASAGSRFSGWSGRCQGLRSCKVNTGISKQKVRATFRLLPQCVVPRLKAKTLQAAKQAIRTHNCTIGKITHATSQTIKQGHVISQNPRPGKRLHHGAKVNVVVSRGRS